MKFAVETWSPEYGTSIEGELDESTQEIDVDIEVAAAAWVPLRPTFAGPRPRMLFIDGVRRVDARVWIDQGGRATPGLCATIGAGVVEAVGREARLVDARIVRGVFAHGAALDPIVTSVGTFDAHAVEGTTPESLVIALQDRMAELEIEVTAGVAGADLLVVDGPLRGRVHVPGAVGYVKTQHTRYLPDDLDAVIGDLAVGERTPLFVIGGGGWGRMSWYSRLPGPRLHSRSGIVRCEVGADDDLDRVQAVADQLTAVLPQFASEAHKDARAPQNLYPIAGLERELRRRLGDAQLIERALRVAASTG